MKVYLIHCRTGCTCCSNENFLEGPFIEKWHAEEKMEQYRKGIDNPLASQYAKYGSYALIEETAEVLPDGRAIIGNRVFPSMDYQSNLCGESDLY